MQQARQLDQPKRGLAKSVGASRSSQLAIQLVELGDLLFDRRKQNFLIGGEDACFV